MDALLVESARALVHAAVRADAPGDEWQGVAFENQLQRLGILFVADQTNVFRDILLNRAAMLAGRDEAVRQRNLALDLANGQRLNRLLMPLVRARRAGKIGNLADGNTFERAVFFLRQFFGNLFGPLISTGFEQRGCKRNRPDARVEQLGNVKEIRAAGEGEAHVTVKLAAEPVRQLNGQRIERAAAHVHFRSGQLVSGNADREGIGQFETERNAACAGKID